VAGSSVPLVTLSGPSQEDPSCDGRKQTQPAPGSPRGPRLNQQEVADQLARLAWLRLRKRVGVNANMVSKWESGAKHPGPVYRELLCLLFRAAPEYLGIGRVTRPQDHRAG
jgi:hypothetical protein